MSGRGDRGPDNCALRGVLFAEPAITSAPEMIESITGFGGMSTGAGGPQQRHSWFLIGAVSVT